MRFKTLFVQTYQAWKNRLMFHGAMATLLVASFAWIVVTAAPFLALTTPDGNTPSMELMMSDPNFAIAFALPFLTAFFLFWIWFSAVPLTLRLPSTSFVLFHLPSTLFRALPFFLIIVIFWTNSAVHALLQSAPIVAALTLSWLVTGTYLLVLMQFRLELIADTRPIPPTFGAMLRQDGLRVYEAAKRAWKESLLGLWLVVSYLLILSLLLSATLFVIAFPVPTAYQDIVMVPIVWALMMSFALFPLSLSTPLLDADKTIPENPANLSTPPSSLS